MKTYIITLAKVFQHPHSRTGEPTKFKEKYLNGEKIHTIRANFPLWQKRMEEVQNGNACLSIRQWSGTPYRSKQEVIFTLTKNNGVGIQPLKVYKNKGGVVSLLHLPTEEKYIDVEWLANNDGLSKEDWKEWFRHYDLSKMMAIIHFTNFRY